jgi:hypothetical protein
VNDTSSCSIRFDETVRHHLSERQRISISLDNLRNLRPTLSTAPPRFPVPEYRHEMRQRFQT